MEQMSDSTVSSKELNSMVKHLKNLTHLRCEAPLIVKLAAEQKMGGWESSTECYLPAKLQSLELPYNFEYRSNPSNLAQFIMTPSEQMLHMILEYTSLPKCLKVVKTVTQAKLPADQFEKLPPGFKDSMEGKRWAQAREGLKRVAKKKNLKLELIDEKVDDWFWFLLMVCKQDDSAKWWLVRKYERCRNRKSMSDSCFAFSAWSIVLCGRWMKNAWD